MVWVIPSASNTRPTDIATAIGSTGSITRDSASRSRDTPGGRDSGRASRPPIAGIALAAMRSGSGVERPPERSRKSPGSGRIRERPSPLSTCARQTAANLPLHARQRHALEHERGGSPLPPNRDDRARPALGDQRRAVVSCSDSKPSRGRTTGRIGAG